MENQSVCESAVSPSAVYPPEFVRFMRGCVWFGLPILLVTAQPLLILFSSGESFRSVDRILEDSPGRQLLVGFAYNEQNYPYLKYRSLIRSQPPAVLALGSSRVLTIREAMFSDRFFNAGYTIQSAADFRTFMQQVPKSHQPEVLLIGLDQWMFNSEWNAGIQPAAGEHWTKPAASSVRGALRLTAKVYTDLARGRISLARLSKRPDDVRRTDVVSNPTVERVGLNAKMNNKGFRNDGSFSYGSQVEQLLSGDRKVRDHQFQDTLSRVETGGNRFNFGEEPDGEALLRVRELLDYCRDNGIHVVAFLPPFADRVLDAMQQSGKHHYMKLIEPQLRPIFDEYGFELYNFSSLSRCGSSDAEAIDGFHAGEVACVRMLREMVERGSRLSRHIDSNSPGLNPDSAVNRYVMYAN